MAIWIVWGKIIFSATKEFFNANSTRGLLSSLDHFESYSQATVNLFPILVASLRVNLNDCRPQGNNFIRTTARGNIFILSYEYLT